METRKKKQIISLTKIKLKRQQRNDDESKIDGVQEYVQKYNGNSYTIKHTQQWCSSSPIASKIHAYEMCKTLTEIWYTYSGNERNLNIYNNK